MRVKPRTPPVDLQKARANAMALDWADYQPPAPRQLGVFPVAAGIETLRHYIDWTPFFMTWSLAGKYPRILEDEVVGKRPSACSTTPIRCWIGWPPSAASTRAAFTACSRPTASATTWKYTATNGVTRCWR